MDTLKGAILGDYVGSVYERANLKGLMLPLTLAQSHITDDAVMTLATLEALVSGTSFALVLSDMCHRYADVEFGLTMQQWLAGESAQYLCSNSNGAATRISPIACLDTHLDDVLRLVEQNVCLTHTGEQAIIGALALAESIYLARHGCRKSLIRQRIERHYRYALEFDIQALHRQFSFTTDARITVPVAIYLGLTANSPEHCLRLALHVGGDTDSIASMACALSSSFEEARVPHAPYKKLLHHLSIHYPELKSMLDASTRIH